LKANNWQYLYNNKAVTERCSCTRQVDIKHTHTWPPTEATRAVTLHIFIVFSLVYIRSAAS